MPATGRGPTIGQGPATGRGPTVGRGPTTYLPVHTEGTRAMLGEHIAALDSGNAHGRAGNPTEIAEIDSFPAGPAGSSVNGAVLFADGGERSALRA
ncbi:hypothetical protein [Streptomyces sp. NPDC088785]|uniref:hypothetical protein n=1 Tax=Streptomyces sp. NPDC088785 TaxID=3365897 RepID=UPI003824CB82